MAKSIPCVAEPWFCAQKDLFLEFWNRFSSLPLLRVGDFWFNKKFPSVFHFYWKSIPLFLGLGSFCDFIGFIVNVFLSFVPFADSKIQGGVQAVKIFLGCFHLSLKLPGLQNSRIPLYFIQH